MRSEERREGYVSYSLPSLSKSLPDQGRLKDVRRVFLDTPVVLVNIGEVNTHFSFRVLVPNPSVSMGLHFRRPSRPVHPRYPGGRVSGRP